MGKCLIGNWKMFMDWRSADSFLSCTSRANGIDVRIAPPCLFLHTMREHAQGLQIKLGAQNMNENKEGAFTGEISPLMLRDAGAEFVILGHSERRHLFGESNKTIEKKVETAVVEGFPFVLCIGETIEEHKEGRGDEVISEQLSSALSSLNSANMKGCMIAYEPVWAIGSKEPASNNVIEQKHVFIRDELKKYFDEDAASISILYGGSVSPKNLDEILTIENVDGTLVGRASLDPEMFNEMIQITGDNS